MNGRKEYAGIDGFRLAAAFMVAAIHTGPFEDMGAEIDFLVTYCLGRLGVPFFLMITGCFLLGRVDGAEGGGPGLKKYLYRLLLLYAGAALLYLPLTVYARKLPVGAGGWAKWFLVDGAFYHLWYFPAAILGCLIVALMKRLPAPWMGDLCVGALYLAGALGDSWYGAAEKFGPAAGFYEAVFRVCEYTRNGLFYAPVFLWLGIRLRRSKTERKARFIWPVFAAVCAAMMAEGYFTWRMGWQRHNSMYFLLPPAACLLFAGLLTVKGRVPAWVRPVSLWFYIIHPFCIVAVRGIAKAAGMKALIVDHSLIFYGAVCATSLLCSCLAAAAAGLCAKWRKRAGRRRLSPTDNAVELPLGTGSAWEILEAPPKEPEDFPLEEADILPAEKLRKARPDNPPNREIKDRVGDNALTELPRREMPFRDGGSYVQKGKGVAGIEPAESGE